MDVVLLSSLSSWKGRGVNLNSSGLPVVGIVTGYRLGVLRNCWFSAGTRILLFSKACRPALGPMLPPVQWVLGALPQGIKGWGIKLTTHFMSTFLACTRASSLLPVPIQLLIDYVPVHSSLLQGPFSFSWPTLYFQWKQWGSSEMLMVHTTSTKYHYLKVWLTSDWDNWMFLISYYFNLVS